MPIRALFLAAGDLLRPALIGLVLRAIALTLVVLIALQAVAIGLIRAFAPAYITLPWLGEVALREWMSWGSLALLPLMGVFLMAPVAATICGLMSDAVAGRIEAIHYPTRRGRDQAFRAGLIDAVQVTLMIIAVTVMTMVLTPFIGPLAPILYYGANGWLIGREFFQTAAVRHMPSRDAALLRARRRGAVTATGIVIALLLTVPIVNIIVPLLAMACFTHLVHLSAAETDPMRRHPRA